MTDHNSIGPKTASPAEDLAVIAELENFNSKRTRNGR